MNKTSQDKFVVTRISMLQQTSSANDKEKRRKYVVIFLESVSTQNLVSAVQDNKTMSRQRKGLWRQQQHATVRNSIATKLKS